MVSTLSRSWVSWLTLLILIYNKFIYLLIYPWFRRYLQVITTFLLNWSSSYWKIPALDFLNCLSSLFLHMVFWQLLLKIHGTYCSTDVILKSMNFKFKSQPHLNFKHCRVIFLHVCSYLSLSLITLFTSPIPYFPTTSFHSTKKKRYTCSFAG